ncbi:ParA family protein [Caldichromatium japonicum]|uniref:ParA family protein n=1 Tax=Caldichromatium japonicum TaxID=2699430 RepID=A0A6G7VEL7_9GAMM|nr:ParA family protein [Caldichromatium japonicum]QIK38298.1 ParA family protein [Caldichromatium japonicum]
MITVVGSLKGGSGKSTLVFNLAVWLIMAETNLLLVDADPQATLTDVIGVRREEGFKPALAVLGKEALDPTRLRAADESLIDVGTADMDGLRLALALADRLLIPVPPSQADVWSAQRFLRMIGEIERPQPLEVIGFINRGDTHHAVQETQETAAALVSLPGLRFVKPRLSQRTIFRRSFSEGLAVFELEPRGKGAHEFMGLAAALYPHLVG